MHPANFQNHEEFPVGLRVGVKSGKGIALCRVRVIATGAVSLLLGVVINAQEPETAGNAKQTGFTRPVNGVRAAEGFRVRTRGEQVPARTEGPVSLTTELSPNGLSSPLLPQGAENEMVEPLPPVDEKKPWTVTLETRAIYDSNIFLSRPGQEQEDFVFLFTPTVAYRRGDASTKRDSFLLASYTASASFFEDRSDENSVDHSFRFDVQKRLGRLAVGVDGKYQRLSGATVELSDRVDRDEAGARLRARYDVSSKTSIEASGGWSTVRYREGALEDYDEWVAETYVGYQVTGRTRIAAGGAAGQLDVEGRQKQDFTRALVKITTEPTGKLTLDAKGGMEWRDTAAGSQNTPVFNVAAEYRPTARTAISGSVYRDVTASGSLEGENVTRTGASVRVQQKIGRAFTAGVEAGYERLKYDTTVRGAVASGREDDYFFIRPSLRYELREGRRLELYYSHREDNSSVNLYDFDADQIGLAFACDF